MFTVSPAAAEQIMASAKEANIEKTVIRVAARRDDDGTIQYAMGFEDHTKDNDLSFNSEGVTILISPGNIELLNGAKLDYVELEPGQFNFIFINPNDPEHVPPQDESGPSEHHF